MKSGKVEDLRNPSLHCREDPRGDNTLRSTSDAESVLHRKADGKDAQLCFAGKLRMDNRNKLYAAITIHGPIAEAEHGVTP